MKSVSDVTDEEAELKPERLRVRAHDAAREALSESWGGALSFLLFVCLQLQRRRRGSDVHEPEPEARQDAGSGSGVEQHGGDVRPSVRSSRDGRPPVQVPLLQPFLFDSELCT